MTRFLHITDLHLTAPETQDPGQQTDTAAALDQVIVHAQQLEPRPDFIIASGDLTNIGDAASYALLAKKMGQLDMPVIYALGNHDSRAGFHTAFPGYAGAPDGPLDHDIVVAGQHVIVLDTSLPGLVSGGFEDGQLDFLAMALERHSDLPKILVIHHPPATGPESQHSWAQINPADSVLLAEAVENYQIGMIFCGHIHLNRVSQWHGVPVISAIGLQSTVSPDRSGGLHITEGTAIGVCDIRPTGIDVVFVPLTQGQTIKVIGPDLLKGLR
ncbi:metallophosphoesterase [Aestuariivita sp.]|jgi:3',5'-cyclic AMP phosphodiesterase CpdA|uniref:metallophosphoesterase n=1 Tax=Aestuariivita sp. TaxID=1872407 RepID=UPI0021713C57|nr:metallophosphoesterase [Aestuariivita sp.]MCE8007326.1 phosphodiesterase [Aestuariivita sp.]